MSDGLPDFEDDIPPLPDEKALEPKKHRPITPPPDDAAYGGDSRPTDAAEDLPPDEAPGRMVYPPPPDDVAVPYEPQRQNPAQWQTGAERVQGSDIHGPLYAFAGKVLKTYYDASPAVHPDTKRPGDVDVAMVDVNWNSSNVPGLTWKMRGGQEPTPGVIVASPMPARQDQPKYVVQAGDEVTVLAEAGGRYYFMSDDLPFIGQVQMGEVEEDATGSNFDGAGNHWIKVRRVQLTGNPALSYGYIYDGSKTPITYPYVQVERAAGFHHGYRPIYDYVLVHRRGAYFFAVPALNSRVGMIVAAGPDDEGDFTTNHYWVKVCALKAAYSGDNAWTEDDTAVVTEFDWIVDAKNIAEADAEHALAAGDEVVLHLFANADTGEAAEFSPYWVFSQLGQGKVDSPYQLLPDLADYSIDTAQTDTWDRGTAATDHPGTKGVKWNGPRFIYDAATGKWRVYIRVETKDSRGATKSFSAESLIEVTPSGACP